VRGIDEKMAVAVILNSSRPMNMRYHLANSAQVLVLSWVSVLAVTTPRVSSNVLIPQRISHETNADFPMPWPEAIACWIARSGVKSPSRIAESRSTCQGSGPSLVANSVPGSAQGKA
jgi:hypothetical protein